MSASGPTSTSERGVGPRVAESGFGLIADYPWSAPSEDLRLKTK